MIFIYFAVSCNQKALASWKRASEANRLHFCIYIMQVFCESSSVKLMHWLWELWCFIRNMFSSSSFISLKILLDLQTKYNSWFYLTSLCECCASAMSSSMMQLRRLYRLTTWCRYVPRCTISNTWTGNGSRSGRCSSRSRWPGTEHAKSTGGTTISSETSGEISTASRSYSLW